MANIFGTTPPKIYLGTVKAVSIENQTAYEYTEYSLEKPTTGGRYEDFQKESSFYFDLNDMMQEKIKGFRVIAKYNWKYITNDFLENLLEIANWRGPVFIKFQTIPRKYEVKVVSFKRENEGGYSKNDAASIEFQGVKLIKAYPNPDLFYATSIDVCRPGLATSI